MLPALLVGARGQQGRCGVVDADECEHQPRRVVRGQLLVEHDLLGHRHSAAPFARPVRYGEARTVQFGEPGLLEGDELLVGSTPFGPGANRVGCARRTTRERLPIPERESCARI